MIASALGTICAFIGIIGWFLSRSVIYLIIGVIGYITETFFEWDNLDGIAKIDFLTAFAIGAFISQIRKVNPWYISGMLAINIWSLATGFLGLVLIPIINKLFLKSKN